MKKLCLLLLLFPGVLLAQSTQPTSAPAGPKGPRSLRYIAPTTEPAAPPNEATPLPVEPLSTEPSSMTASQPSTPAVLAAAETPKPKAPDESERLQGIWRSTRDPLGDYRLRGADEERSPVRARRIALGLTLAGYGILSLSGASYYSREFGAGDSKIPEWFTSPVPLALGAGLVIVGPSAGHIYAGEPLHAIRYSLRRALGATLTSVGASGVYLVLRGAQEQGPVAGMMAIAGTAITPIAIPGMLLLVRGASREIRDAKYAALRHNAARQLQQALR